MSRPVTAVLLAFALALAVGGLAWIVSGDADGIDPLPEIALPRAARGTPGTPALPTPRERDGRPAPAPTAPGHLAPPPPLRLAPPLVLCRVVDAETGRPVPSFSFQILPHDDATDPLVASLYWSEAPTPVRGSASGILRAERPAGTWDVVVFAPGYLPGSLAGLVVPYEQMRPVDIPVRHGLSIAGQVTDENGLGVRDVPVFLAVTRLFGDVDPPRATVATTDPAGRFRFSPLPPGEYAVALLEPDNALDRQGGLMLERGTLEVSLFLAPRHQVLVSVRDPGGLPLADASVELVGSTAPDAVTNESGQARLRFVSPGDYVLRVRAEGHAPSEEPLSLPPGAGEVLRWVTLDVVPTDG